MAASGRPRHAAIRQWPQARALKRPGFSCAPSGSSPDSTLDEATVPDFDISLKLRAQAWMIGRKTVEIHYTQRRSESGKALFTARPPGRGGDLARKELFSTARVTSVT
jgi:hypothetical protein